MNQSKNTSTLEFVKASLSWVGIFGVLKILRSDEGSKFISYMTERLKYLLKYQYLIIVPYHPQGNSMVERRMKEVGELRRALVYEYRIKSEWSHYLRQVLRIINYIVDGSIGTQPGRVIFGDMVGCDLTMDLPGGTTGRNSEDYLLKHRESQSILL